MSIEIRETLKTLNKNSISQATGIEYSRLRKYASGQIKTLTNEEVFLIKNYLLETANKFN